MSELQYRLATAGIVVAFFGMFGVIAWGLSVAASSVGDAGRESARLRACADVLDCLDHNVPRETCDALTPGCEAPGKRHE